ncbi:MAG: hypothetical protein QXQ57_01900 [Sulfolobales archaeon]
MESALTIALPLNLVLRSNAAPKPINSFRVTDVNAYIKVLMREVSVIGEVNSLI